MTETLKDTLAELKQVPDQAAHAIDATELLQGGEPDFATGWPADPCRPIGGRSYG